MHVPWLVFAEPNSTPNGRMSKTETAVAAYGPAFVTVIVYVMLEPASIGPAGASFISLSSAKAFVGCTKV